MSTMVQRIDPGAMRRTLGRFTTGVTVVTTARGNDVHAMTANAFTSVSLDPPLVLVSVDHRTRMHALLPDTRRYGISVLGSDQERVAWHFAGRPLRDPGELFEWAGDVPFVRGAIARVGCSLHAEHEAIPFAVPYRRPAGFASGRVTSADNVLVRVHTDAGLVGQAEAQPRPYTYGESQISIVHTVRTTLQELLVGVNPLNTEMVAERCGRIAGNYVARGAVDLAAWDLAGQVLGRPCHTLLGGFSPDVVAAHMVSFDTPEAMADDAVAVHERLGVRTFKVKVGRPPALDIAATRAIREALPDAELYVDANRGWTYEDAVRAGDELVALGVRAIEEPISVDDRAGRLRLADRWPVPIIGDESCISLVHVARALDERAVRAVSVKTEHP